MSIKFYNEVEIPTPGFGTWQVSNEDAYNAVKSALACGYRHIDTAQAYGNEQAVGQAIHDSGINRKDIFVTSKLPAELKGYEITLETFQKTLEILKFDYLDLYLIHAPWPWNEIGKDCHEGNIASWKTMEELYEDGKIRAIGVSNFSPVEFEPFLKHCKIIPMANQISYCIGNTQKETVKLCRNNDILVEAYCPLGSGRLLNNVSLAQFAEKYSVSVAQLCIRYCLQNKTIPLPKSVTPTRMEQNLKLNFTISDANMALLDEMNFNC
jgi:diketogulonate reductase-like aldo/keto reductase